MTDNEPSTRGKALTTIVGVPLTGVFEPPTIDTVTKPIVNGGIVV